LLAHMFTWKEVDTLSYLFLFHFILYYIMADTSLYNATETPVLISNIEVLELLQKQRIKRQQLEVAAAAQIKGGGEPQQQHQGDNSGGDGGDGNGSRPLAKKHRRVRHRDWIEEKVMQYIQSTPCMQIVNSNRPERHQLEKKLTSLPKKKSSIGSSSSESSTFNSATTLTTDASTNGSTGQQKQQHGGGYGLMPAEALQILNFMPTQMVEIHLMIEELNERMTEKQQEEFLKFMRDTIASFQNKNNGDKYAVTTKNTTRSSATASSVPTASSLTTTAQKDMSMETESSESMVAAHKVMVEQAPT
jgi:RNA polymerase Rpb4